MFTKQPSKPDFFKIQQEVLAEWKKDKTFEKSIEQRPASKPYRFYDGPPFITGTPHYGSLLSSICKDVVPRYQTMKGKRVERVRGWDCHGLPIEQKVQKKLGLESNKEIEKLGVEKFIQECYTYTRTNSAEWEWYVDNIGRWVDFKNSYKTMDQEYMESVMRVFKQLYDKGLIYEGKRVSLYSTKLSTPISGFEVAMDGDENYKDINDPAIVVMFDLATNGEKRKNTYALAWTTTPWTIPANIALAVNKNLTYVKVMSDNLFYIVAKARVGEIFKGKNYEIVEEFLGKELLGLSYKPPYEYYYGKTQNKKDYHIYHGDFATDEEGTGIVHQAPEFGDVDFQLAKEVGLTITEALDNEGKYTEQIYDKRGMFYRDANSLITKELEEKDVLFAKGSITHRVAHCPRSGVPLIYKAQHSWFINIQAIKKRLLEKNHDINWYPEHFKYGRFAKSIEAAPDRCISRTRYRGTPMPVRRSEDGKETIVIGSRDELFRYNKPYKQLIKLILVRHGRTDYNEAGRLDPLDESRLSELGKKQAKLVTKQLQNEEIDAIYSSPLTRCIQTIQEIAKKKKLPILQDARLTEIGGGLKTNDGEPVFSSSLHPISLTQAKEIKSKEGKTLTRHKSPQETFEDVQAFLQEILLKHAGETVVICTHFDIIALIEKVLDDYDYENPVLRMQRGISNKELKAPLRYTYVLTSTGKKFDLHKPYIDEIKIQSPTTGQTLTRIPEVLDVWLDSASMPYAQVHYPFENRKKFEKSFPADFIVEYTGQIRAWFYVMHVIGVALFDQAPFKNVLCTGVMNGNDGRKMSKSYGNYPDPKESIIKYGADAIRMHIIGSPVVYGGDTDIKEEYFVEAVKKYILPLRNAFYFFVTYANIDKREPKKAKRTSKKGDVYPYSGSTNILDKRIVSELQLLIQEVDKQMSVYNLQAAVRPIVTFLDNLTNRYIRRSRRRFRKSENDKDKKSAYETLYYVLITFCQVASPFMPFITEYIWKNLTKDTTSVHLTKFPKVNKKFINKKLSERMRDVQNIITCGLSWRARNKIRVRQPLKSVTISCKLEPYFRTIVAEELNVKKVLYDPNLTDKVTKIVKLDGKKVGKKLGEEFQRILELGKSGRFKEIDGKTIQIEDYVFGPDEYQVDYLKKDPKLDVEVQNTVIVAMDPTITPQLELEGYARDLVRFIQEARKKANFDIAERIHICIEEGKKEETKKQTYEISKLISLFGPYIEEETLGKICSHLPTCDIQEVVTVGEKEISFKLKKME